MPLVSGKGFMHLKNKPEGNTVDQLNLLQSGGTQPGQDRAGSTSGHESELGLSFRVLLSSEVDAQF